MGIHLTWHPDRDHRWQSIFHPATDGESDAGLRVLQLQGLRLAGLFAAALLWVVFTLATGIFSVALVIPLGIAVGGAHLALRRRLHRAHLPSALALTLAGGIVANVLAGLALFSATYGVGYRQVLSGRRIPEDLPMLVEAFVQSFRLQDALFYCLAVLAVLALTQFRHTVKESARG